MPPPLCGRILDFDPVVRAGINSAGEVVLGRGRIRLVVDSGFNGDLALPHVVLGRLRLEYMGMMPYSLADGVVKEFDNWSGVIVLNDGPRGANRVGATLIEGDGLLGMDFMMKHFRRLEMDFDQRLLQLIRRPSRRDRRP